MIAFALILNALSLSIPSYTAGFLPPLINISSPSPNRRACKSPAFLHSYLVPGSEAWVKRVAFCSLLPLLSHRLLDLARDGPWRKADSGECRQLVDVVLVNKQKPANWGIKSIKFSADKTLVELAMVKVVICKFVTNFGFINILLFR